jgi:hypothetical protein
MSARRMTADQAAEATGLSLTTLRLMHSQGSLRCDSDGMYRAADIERPIERRSNRR